MRNPLFTLVLGGALALSLSGTAAVAQDNANPTPSSAQTPGQDQGEAAGQPGHGPMRMDPDKQLEHMSHALGLSADQQSQIKPLLVERKQKMEAIFQDQSLPRQDRHAKIQSIRQDTQSKIEAVLNDQQKQKFDAMQERMRNHGRAGEGGMGNGAPPPQI